MMPQWAVADAVLSDGDKTLTITTTAPGQVSSMVSELSLTSEQKAAITKIVLDGKFYGSDVEILSADNGFTAVTTVDMSHAKYISSSGSGNPRLYRNPLASYNGFSGVNNGDKAYFNVGDNLFQLRVGNTTPQWKSFSDLNEVLPTSANHTYTDYLDMTNHANQASVGETGRYPTSYEYCQVISTISNTWIRKTGVDIVNEAYAANVNADIQEKLSSAGDAAINKTMYIYFQLRDDNNDGTWNWEYVDVSDALKQLGENQVDYNGDPNGDNANINNLSVVESWMQNNYIHFTYVYSKIDWQKTSGQDIADGQSFKNAFNFDVAKKLHSLGSETTSKNLVVYFQSKKNANNDNYHWEYRGVFDEGQHPYESLNDGQQDYPEYIGSGANINELENANNHPNNYFHFNFTYNSITKAWGEPTATEPTGEGVNIVNAYNPTFDVNDREIYLGDNAYAVGNWVKMYSGYEYYRLIETTPRNWDAIPYVDGNQFNVVYNFASLAARNSNTTAQNGDYAVVGATLLQYNGTTWGDVTDVYDWTQMRFTKIDTSDPLWSTLQSVILPDGIKNSDLRDNNFWPANGGNKITKVQSGTTIATIYKSENSNDKLAKLNVPCSTDENSEFVRMKNIITKNNFVEQPDQRVTSSVAEGYASGRYTVTGTFDASTINEFNTQDETGITVLDLSNATGVTKDELNKLIRSSIQYIILPAGMDKDFVCDESLYYETENGEITNTKKSSLPNLKGVISSSSTDLVAYLTEPGSLAEARCLATGNSGSQGQLHPTPQSLASVTLGGKLYLDDITTSQSHLGLSNELSSITSLDLEKAVFINPSTGAIDSEQMNIHNAGFNGGGCHLSTLILPRNANMNTIAEGCFDGLKSLQEICIPYNYQHIKKDAFKQSNVYHITTTDSEFNEIDNGPHTYTFSANLKSIGESAFRVEQDYVTDVYVLAIEAPTCEAFAFGDGPMYYGDGGHDGGDLVYCRDLYIKSSTVATLQNGDKDYTGAIAICMLHYPDGLTPEQEAKYTDVDKVYTKKDQTGAVDGNGDPLLWPTRSEMNRVFKQALSGVLWDDESWKYEDGSLYNNNQDVFWKENTQQPEEFSFKGYVGWHQFVLSKATYVPTIEDNKDERDYTEGDWYTFCIPFDMTEDEVIELMGVPATTDDVTYKLNGTEVSVAHMPEIHTLKGVERNLNGSHGDIILSLSDNLAEKKDGNYTYYNESENCYEPNSPALADESRNGKIVIRGGYPYLIKPYVRKINGEKVVIDRLGEYIMKRYDFPKIASSVYRSGCFINLGGTYIQDGTTKTSYASPFATPYTGHEVQALFKNVNAKAAVPAYYMENGKKVDYKYRFMGQYWEQPLPLGSYFVNKNNWFYYKTLKNGFYWRRYSCILNVSSSLLDENASFRGDPEVKTSYYHQIAVDAGGGAVFDGNLKLVYNDAHDDSFVTNENQGAEVRSIRIVFDDVITEYDDEGNEVTAIQMLDGQNIMPRKSDKVYNLKGQFVGNSVDGLQKGLYIVNGKKIVVD